MQIPFFLHRSYEQLVRTWDLTTQKVRATLSTKSLPWCLMPTAKIIREINGVRAAVEIAASSGVSLPLVIDCLENLLYALVANKWAGKLVTHPLHVIREQHIIYTMPPLQVCSLLHAVVFSNVSDRASDSFRQQPRQRRE